MIDRRRILLVEDTPSARDNFAAALRACDYDVDVAANLREAERRLLDRTYHVAIVDVYLGGADNFVNEDGRHVVDFISGLNEGTVAVVVSATDRPQLAANLLQVHGAKVFLSKKEIESGGLAALEDVVKKGLGFCKLNLLPPGKDYSQFLAGDPKPHLWVHECLQRLSPDGGVTGLDRFFSGWLKKMLPALPIRGNRPVLAFQDQSRALQGCCWSKAIGAPCWLFAQPRADSVEILKSTTYERLDWDKPLILHEAAGLRGIVLSDVLHSRSDFVDRMV